MAAIYGHRWNSAYGDCLDSSGRLTLAADTWRRGLAGITERQVAVGIQSALVSADPWPPTLPSFRSLCLGVPTLASLKLRLRKETDDPFTRLVWQNLDGYRLKQVTADKADRMIRDAYETAREHVMSGGELPEVSGHIEAPKPEPRTPASRETAESHLHAMAEKLGVMA